MLSYNHIILSIFVPFWIFAMVVDYLVFTLFVPVSRKGWLKHNHDVSTVNYPFVKTKITYHSKKVLTRHFISNNIDSIMNKNILWQEVLFTHCNSSFDAKPFCWKTEKQISYFLVRNSVINQTEGCKKSEKSV